MAHSLRPHATACSAASSSSATRRAPQPAPPVPSCHTPGRLRYYLEDHGGFNFSSTRAWVRAELTGAVDTRLAVHLATKISI